MKSKVEIFKAENTAVELRVKLEDETVWLSQEQMSQLFERNRTVIGRHIRNIFKEGELDEEVVCANFARTTLHGAIPGKTKKQSTVYYNLDVIISVGYQVKSQTGKQFRQWATQRLNGYI